VGPVPTKSASGKEYEYIVVDDYSRAVYTRPLRLKSDAPEAFRIFKAAAENEPQKGCARSRWTTRKESSVGEMKQICEQEGIKLYTSVRYSPESNGVAERMTGVHVAHSGLPRILWAEADNADILA